MTEGTADTALSAEPTRAPSESGGVRWLVESALILLFAFLFAQGVKAFVVQPFVIPTGSMRPTIVENDYVLAEKLSYRLFSDVKRGDIVVFDDPTGSHPQLIKRVVATAGQVVDIRGGAVFIDGERLTEPYTRGRKTEPGTIPTPLRIPEGSVWLMGDNRPDSGDSRFFGPRPVDTVRGRAFWKYWPAASFGALE